MELSLRMEKTNKIMWWLWYIFFIGNIGDVISTIFIYEAESNPIFLSFKNVNTAFYFLIITKALFIFAFWYIIRNNKYKTEAEHFFIILVLVYVDIILLLAVSYNTYAGFFNTQIIEEGNKISKQERGGMYIKQMLIIFYIPMLLCYTSFRLWMKSRYKAIYKEETMTYDNWIKHRLK